MLRLSRITVIPVADESLGVRSMSLFVETPDSRILFDGGVSLGPYRYGLPPHPEEFRALYRRRLKILEYAEKADIVTISHYHRDHYTPPYQSLYECTEQNTFQEIYDGKILLIKSPEKMINYNQKKRVHTLIKALENSKTNVKLIYLDEGRYIIGTTLIEGFLSLHGDEKLGWVLCFKIYVDDEPLLVFLPDVQGPVLEETLKVLLGEKFKVAVIGGPPTYLSREGFNDKVEKGLINLARALEFKRVNILSHHILRDPDWRNILDSYSPSAKFRLYSEILETEFTPLEAYRNLLYETDPPPPSYLESLKNKTLSCSDFQ